MEMADPVVADPTPDPTPPTPPIVPGWKTSEAWLSLIVIILGALPSSGLTDNAPTLAKIVGIISAAIAAINYTHQRSALKRAYYTTASARRPQSRSQVATAATLLVALCAINTLPSCTAANCQDPKNVSSAQCSVDNAVVDCTGVSSLSTAVAVVTPIIEKLIATARQPDGSINWASIESQIVDLALQYGGCVIAQVWSDLSRPALTAQETGSTAKTRPSPDDLKQEFDRIRARVAPGRSFTVSGGRKL